MTVVEPFGRPLNKFSRKTTNFFFFQNASKKLHRTHAPLLTDQEKRSLSKRMKTADLQVRHPPFFSSFTRSFFPSLLGDVAKAS